MKKLILLALIPVAQVAYAGPKIDLFLSVPLVAPTPVYVPPPIQYRENTRIIRTYEPQYYDSRYVTSYPTIIYNNYPRRDYYYRYENHDHHRLDREHRDRDWNQRYDRDYRYYDNRR